LEAPGLCPRAPHRPVLGLPPLTLLARERQDNVSAVIDVLNEFLPVLDQIGLDRSHPVNGLNAVAVAAVIASKIDPEHRSWIGELPSLQDNAFAPLLAKWERLITAESGWRKQFLTYGKRTWRQADEIRSAANFLRKKGIGKWISGLTSAGKAAWQTDQTKNGQERANAGYSIASAHR
jgi:hypothetical protein